MATIIIWSNIASSDLRDILEFFNIRNKSNTYSKKLYKTISQEINRLIIFPEIGRVTDYKNFRSLVVLDYLIFYTLIDDNIFIIRVWDSRQDERKISF